MADQHFHIADTSSGELWAEYAGPMVQFHHTTQAPDGDQQDSVVLELEKEALRNILVWADQESSVTVSLTGPMAAQVRQMAKELGLPPEMFIWHAVKVFIEAGAP